MRAVQKKGLKPSSKTSSSPYLSKTLLLDAGDAVRASGRATAPSSLKPVSARTATPAKTGSLRDSISGFICQQRAAQRETNSPASKASRGIALGQDQEDRARKEGFLVDSTGNAIRIVTES
jgi:hypothetical protein